MSVLSSLAARLTTLSPQAVDHLHRLLAEWQLLADLSFADALLFSRVAERPTFLVLAQVRPFPAQTLYDQDMVGAEFEERHRPRVAQAFEEHRIVREGEPEWRDGIPVREETIPVTFRGTPIAVISLEQNLATARTPSHLELSYLRAAGDLAQMIADGTFPFPEDEGVERELAPRVGDGLVQIDAAGIVTYASPNAVSAFHRLGVTANLVELPLRDLGIPTELLERLRAGIPVDNELEANGAWMLQRLLPIVRAGDFRGAILLNRDITELRRRDRMLVIKDATIREIHHRVKNNLQTVASLLRLQARRGSPEARAELEESVRRIASIALVHETLSLEGTERVEFDIVAQRVLDMVEASLTRPDRPVRFSLVGSAGRLPSDIATPLSLIIAELIQNAVDHAFPGRGGSVTVELKRTDPGLLVRVADDGVGLPQGFDIATTTNLGLQIVRTLAIELGGTIDVTTDGGSRFEVTIPFRTEGLEHT